MYTHMHIQRRERESKKREGERERKRNIVNIPLMHVLIHVPEWAHKTTAAGEETSKVGRGREVA